MSTDYLKWGAIAIFTWIVWKEMNISQYISGVGTAARETYHAKESFAAPKVTSREYVKDR